MADKQTWPPPPETAPTAPPVAQTPLQKLLTWMFAVPQGKRSAWQIIKWWELRRIPYNVIVLGVGIVSLLLFFFFITHSHVLKDGEDAEEPMAIIAAPFVMNFAYSAGWVVECLFHWFSPDGTENMGPNLLRGGLIFSLVVVLFPSLLWGLTWMGQIVSGR